MLLLENIVVDIDKKEVDYSPSDSENGLDISVENNPQIYYLIDQKIEVYSIFKRLKSDAATEKKGLALLYALKNYKGWRVRNNDSLNKIYQHFRQIVRKIDEEFEVAISLPSKNPLNTWLLNRIVKLLSVGYSIDTPIIKITNGEVFNNIDYKNLPKPIASKVEEIANQLDLDSTFEIKKIPPAIRQHFNHYFKFDNTIEDIFDIAAAVDGKKLLLIDDSITSGTTIINYIKLFSKMFNPKSTTIITLFSRAI